MIINYLKLDKIGIENGHKVTEGVRSSIKKNVQSNVTKFDVHTTPTIRI